MRSRLAWYASLTLLGVASPSYGCPDLSGIFECPAFLNKAARTLTISTTINPDRSTTYRFEYTSKAGEKTAEEYQASETGVPAPNGYVRICKGTEFVVRPVDNTQSGTINFINSHHDYQFQFGSTNVTCVRRSK